MTASLAQEQVETMTKIVTVDQMKVIEAAADQAGVTYAMMMDAAGNAVAEHVLARLEALDDDKIVVLTGSGNNGGDGLVAAHRLAEAGASVSVYAAKPLDESDPKVQRLRQKSIFVADAENDTRWRVLKNLMGGVTVLVDAVFGTGVRLPLSGKAADLLKQVGKHLAERDSPRPLIVAVDCPSGLNCDTGELDPLTLAADATVTFAAVKRGQLVFPGAEAVGDLAVADIGLEDRALPELESVALDLATEDAVRALLPARPRYAHKGTFGRVVVAAGSVNYTGAAYLSGAAAYRVGAGLVTLAVPMPLHAILAGQLPEATWLILPHELGVIAASAADVLREALPKAQALLVGPGLGLEKETAAFIRRLLGVEVAGARHGSFGFLAPAAAEADPPAALPPLVVDADGLKLLAQIEGWAAKLPRATVLTPHPGEMAVLTGLDRNALEADRVGAAQRFAAEWGHVVVLKGAYTVVAAPDGRATLQPFATAALARAGTGDVLAGAIAGLLAQGLAPYEAAVTGAFLHGLAGTLAAQRLGSTAAVLAGDVLAGLIEAQADLAA
ncbi:MAG: NAD(P)H-hydrate dehydratase [Anaerolineales bacterium]|nr:NAD(P)H-hydrate dehydratase [Anaerolineales bacterium]